MIFPGNISRARDRIQASSLMPAYSKPDADLQQSKLVAVSTGDKPFILCGPAGNQASKDQAAAFAASPWVRHIAKFSGRAGQLNVAVVDGSQIKWQSQTAAIMRKPSGSILAEGTPGSVFAFICDDKDCVLASMLCLDGPLLKSLDSAAPDVPDGFSLLSP